MLLKLVDWVIYEVFGLSPQQKWVRVAHFFVYDSVKILVLLVSLIFVIGVLRTYLPPNKIRAWIAKKGLTGHIFAALFGAITPFCSCSSIPIFLGFLEAGVPLGVTFSFLIASPIINEYLVILMLGFFGWKITALYVLSGVGIGVTAGVILGRLPLERHLVSGLVEKRQEANGTDPVYTDFMGRVRFGWNEAVSITSKIWLWVLAGVAVGALIHNYVPQETIRDLISKTGPFSVPIAVLLGVPMYGSCAAIVPIAVVLFQKGVPLGTALSFMMAIAALSLPEAIMLRRAMRLPLILVFFGVTTAAIIVIGYMFNAAQVILSS